MNKITKEQLNRKAYVYVRQSTPRQIKENTESRRLQYALTERAKDLGWRDVGTVDEDSGRSGSGVVCQATIIMTG